MTARAQFVEHDSQYDDRTLDDQLPIKGDVHQCKSIVEDGDDQSSDQRPKDGSDSADTAIDGLQRAGLPAANVEALVVSFGEVWLPPPDAVGVDTSTSQTVPGLKEVRERAAQVMEVAEQLAQRGSKDIPGADRGLYPLNR